jgi:thiol-disulfide isomerase/thioredoxin
MMGGIGTAQQKPFTITGSVKGKTDGVIYLSYNRSEGPDSSRIENGRFSFKGTLDGPVQAIVMFERNPKSFNDFVQLYITPGNMQLSLDFNKFPDDVNLKGSSVQDEAEKLNKLKAPIMAQIKPLSEAYNKANGIYIAAMKAKKDEATLDALKEKANEAKDAMDPYYKQIGDIDKEFMDNHPASYVTASLLRYRISGMPIHEGEARYNKLTDAIKNSSLGKEIKETLDGLRKGSPGAKAYVFSSTELRGEPLSLADFKGKYVLVDFWASWCVPCRAGNPHLLKLYSKYKNSGKGLEIIGISDDDGHPDAWKKAVEKDGIGVWKHVLRGLKQLPGYKFDRSADISDHYGIHSLPTKILIDPNGMIIGRYGGGGENDEAMDKEFSEIFGG